MRRIQRTMPRCSFYEGSNTVSAREAKGRSQVDAQPWASEEFDTSYISEKCRLMSLDFTNIMQLKNILRKTIISKLIDVYNGVLLRLLTGTYNYHNYKL